MDYHEPTKDEIVALGHPPACADCRYRIGYPANWSEPSHCVRPIGRHYDPVAGIVSDVVDRRCASERSKDRSLFSRRERCGPYARFFEPVVERTTPRPRPTR